MSLILLDLATFDYEGLTVEHAVARKGDIIFDIWSRRASVRAPRVAEHLQALNFNFALVPIRIFVGGRATQSRLVYTRFGKDNCLTLTIRWRHLVSRNV